MPVASQTVETGLAGKRVLVTGGSGGIGSACAREFAAEGAHVLVHYRTGRERADAVAAEVRGEVVQADLTVEHEVDALFEEAGPLDVCAAVAGAWPQDDVPVWELPLERWDLRRSRARGLRRGQSRARRIAAQPEERDRACRAAGAGERGLSGLDRVADDARAGRSGARGSDLADDGAPEGGAAGRRGSPGRHPRVGRAFGARHRPGDHRRRRYGRPRRPRALKTPTAAREAAVNETRTPRI